MGSKRKRRRGSDSRYPSSSDETSTDPTRDAMGSKRKRRRGSDSSYPSASDETSTDPTTPPRRSTAESLRSTRKKEDKLIKRMLEELKDTRNELRKQLKELTDETRKQFKELTESQNKLCKQLELHINGLSGDDSAASRSESNQVQPPRYRLEFTCEVNDEIEKEKIIETKPHGKMISVALKDDQNQIVKTGPLASAKVKLVVINGEFNQQDNQCNWSRKEFEKAIRRPPNSATGDVNQSTESIVKNCFFNLIGGVKSHGDATILYNSSNKKVRLAVMMVSPTEERVLEGLSNPFFVRGHDRNRTKKQKQALAGFGFDERNAGLMLHPSCSHLTQPREIIPQQLPGNSIVLPTDQPLLPGNTIVLPTELSTSAWIQQDQNSHPTMYGTSMVQAATHSLHAGGEHSVRNDLMNPYSELCNYSIGNGSIPIGYGMQHDMDYIALPVQLLWDRPIVEPRKSWNLLDQLMPLYSCQPKFYNYCGLPTMHPTTELLGSLMFILKDVVQTCRRRGVLVKPLDRDDSHEKGPVERRLHSKYKLRFVNKVCQAYYIRKQIKADDGNPLKVALFDENDRKITSGPLSSASVEVVALHGDFNADGQNFWTPEDFSRCIVCPRPGKSEAVLGGDRILTLADGEACLGDAYFLVTSFHARTGKFMMGVRVASAQGGRIQEGTSEPFLVMERAWQVPRLRHRYHPPMGQDQASHYLRLQQQRLQRQRVEPAGMAAERGSQGAPRQQVEPAGMAAERGSQGGPAAAGAVDDNGRQLFWRSVRLTPAERGCGCGTWAADAAGPTASALGGSSGGRGCECGTVPVCSLPPRIGSAEVVGTVEGMTGARDAEADDRRRREGLYGEGLLIDGVADAGRGSVRGDVAALLSRGGEESGSGAAGIWAASAPAAGRDALDACALCAKPLRRNSNIFMYKGDTPFCSEECRYVQIQIDERPAPGRAAAGAGSSSSSRSVVRRRLDPLPCPGRPTSPWRGIY